LPCACEQAVFAVDAVYEQVREEFRLRGCHILTPAEKKKVDPVIALDGHLNPAIIGQLPVKIAALGGVTIPETTRVLMAECERIDPEEAFCREKLSPTPALYSARDYNDAVEKAQVYLSYGGQGHSATLHTNQTTHLDRIKDFGIRIPVSRVAINQGNVLAVSGAFNVKVAPTFTLGCGSWGGNSISENVGVKHVMNTKQVVERRDPVQCYRVPPRIYFNPKQELSDKRRAMVITDRDLYEQGFPERVTGVLNEIGVDSQVFSDVESRPSVETVHKGAAAMQQIVVNSVS
jgi:acetaldehyde dehydrogenase/alcohol dehydrogenase